MSESLLQLGGAPSSTPYKKVPLTTSSFFSGLVTQRSPFGSPDGRYYAKFLGGRTDILIAGSNVELTNYGTIIRRPGNPLYSTASLGSSPLTFYSFHQLNNAVNPIQVIADTITNVYTLTPTAKTSILTKANGAGQSYFQGIGSTLYIGDSVDLQAWIGTGSTRNWGITMNSTADTTGPNACGTGSDVAFSGGGAWANPGNITLNDGSFATITLASGSGTATSTSATFGTVATGNTNTVGGGIVFWSNPSNVLANDSSFTTTILAPGRVSDDLIVTGFGFGIPANASINGVTVAIQEQSSADEPSDNVIKLLKAGVAVGTNKAANTWPSIAVVNTYGGSADLWGTTWTPSDINDPNFGVAISVTSGASIDNASSNYVTITINYTVPAGTAYTDYLEGTNFGFGLSTANTISGVLVEVKGLETAQPTGSSINIQILKNGVLSGSPKNITLTGSNAFVSLGGSNDLWGTTFSPGDINSSTFGVAIQGLNSSSSSASWSIDFVRITVFGTGGPSISTTGSGSFSAVTGYQYVYAYGNSNSGNVSNPTPPSANTGVFGGGISTSTIANAGTGYAANDTGIISAGNFDATYKVLTVSGGNVLTYSITAAGTGYSADNNVSTARAGSQPGAGTGFAINITAITGVSSVQVVVTASSDSQVNQIRVFRTKDGGSTFFELPTSPYANTSTTISDSSADADLNTQSFFSFSPWLANSPPPAGLIKMTYHLNRMWGVVGNFVYFSALLGDDITLGVGVECWPPSNVFTFPTQVNRLMPIASGLLVFTTDDIYLISGTSRDGTTGPILTSQLFQQGVGLLSYNALDVEGNQIFLYTSDRQFVSFTASGPIEIGYPIGVDIQTNIDPSLSYVAALIAGTQDKAVFLTDGSASWYRCNWNQPPEGGPAWSPKATIVGGATAVVSVETSPGVHQLLIGQSNGTVLTRSYSTFSDNGSSYTASATVGSLVLAKPGQLALLDSIVLELQPVGSVPTVSLLLDEISGSFETLIKSVDDPPNLKPSTTVMSKRWYLSQGNLPAFCRHIQLQVSWPSEAFKNELLTITEIGALIQDK